MRGVHIAVVVLALSIAANGCSGKSAVRTADDAESFIAKVAKGTDHSEFKLAEDASPVARVAMDDVAHVQKLKDLKEKDAGPACDAVDWVSRMKEPDPNDTSSLFPAGYDYGSSTLKTAATVLSVLTPQGLKRVDPSVIERVVQAAEGMAESTWVDAVAQLCGAASQT